MTDSDVGETVNAEATSTSEAGTQTQTAPKPAAAAKPAPAAPETKTTKDSPPAEPPKPVVPANYEFKDKDGKALTGPVIDAIAKMGKEHGWTQDVASKQLPVLAQAVLDSRTAQQALWKAQLEADKEIGGSKLAENLGIAAKARQEFGGPELDQFLDETGLGDHPVVARLFHKIGKAISPDGFTAGSRITGRPGDIPNPNDTSVARFGKIFESATPQK